MKIKYWDKSTTNIKRISSERNIKLGTFKDCIIEGNSIHYPQPLIKTDLELLLPTIEKFMSLGRGTVYESKMERECTNKNLKSLESKPVFYFVYNCANYFHWIYDTVPYLYSYFKEKETVPNLKLLMSPPENTTDLYPFVYETLELLGIEKSDIVFLDKNTKYKTIVIGSSLTHNRMSLKPPHSSLFSILDSINGSDSKFEKIYVSRRTWTQKQSLNIGTDYTKQRMCTNEDEIVEYLESKGYTEIFCENYSMKEKIGIFRNATHVIGPIGGGMSNVLFCNPHTKVISINSPDFFPINERLKYALNHTKLHMFNSTKFVDKKEGVITGKNALSISGGMNSTWKVDINKFKKIATEFSYVK